MLVLCRQCVQYVLEGTVTCPHCGGDARQMSARYRDGDGPASDPHLRLRHKTIKKVTADLEAMKFNTAIAALMEYVNDLSKGGVTRDDAITLAQLTAPFAPHVADEAWEMLGQQGFGDPCAGVGLAARRKACGDPDHQVGVHRPVQGREHRD